MSARWEIPRRTFLRGVGTAVALPLLDVMSPEVARGAAAVAPPRRTAFLFIPNGVQMSDWTPSEAGRDFSLPPTLEPLAELRDKLLVISGLAHQKAEANGDGGGDHARNTATFLTGCQARKTAGRDLRAGISVDQYAAQYLRGQTRLPSLELGCERGKQAGSCDSGYSCAYSANISWRSEQVPMPKEVNPRAVFERLFAGALPGETTLAHQRRNRFRRSVLDMVREDATQLQRRLGQRDREKLDEYLTSIRELERQLEFNAKVAEGRLSAGEGSPLQLPDGIPRDYAAHIRLMGDLLALAFQMDQTRVATFMFANAGSNRSYTDIGVSEGHHELSHHRGDQESQRKIAQINRFHVEQFAAMLRKLDSMQEGNGSVLDNTAIVFGSGISDGNRHSHRNLPILVAGGGGGSLPSGQHLRVAKDTPLMNLYLSLLRRMDVPCESLGDSTGPLLELASASAA